MRILKRGFTLVELLAVLVIIGLIGGIAIKYILAASNSAKEKSNTEMENIIKSSVYSYIRNDNNLLNDIKIGGCESVKTIKLSTLVNKKYLSTSDLINPSNKKSINVEESYVKVYYGTNDFSSDGSCIDSNNDSQDYDYRYYVNIVDKE